MANLKFLGAAVQMCSGENRRENLAKAGELVAQAAGWGAKLVVLPEVFAWRGPKDAEKSQAESIPGPSSDLLSALAKSLEIHLLGGSILEAGDGPLPFNTSLLYGPDGRELGRYRKLHLFDVEIEGQVSIRESDTRRPGGEIVIADTELGRLGMTICYDLRFPELFRALALRGADMITVPSAFTFYTGSAHWEPLLRARAIENLVHILAADQVGGTPGGSKDYGHSMIIDPWGTPLAQASDSEGVILAEIDLGRQARLRNQLPCLEHVRIPIE